MAVRMRRYVMARVGGNLLKRPLELFAFRAAPTVPPDMLRKTNRPSSSVLHDIDPDPDCLERTCVTPLRNDMEPVRYTMFADVCRIAVAKNMRRNAAARNSPSSSSSSSSSSSASSSAAASGPPRMSNAAAAAAAANSFDAVAQYIRSRMTDLYDGSWHVVAAAARDDGRRACSSFVDPRAADVAIVSDGSGMRVFAFRHADDTQDPLCGCDGRGIVEVLMDPHSNARALATTIMFGFIALYFVLGKTSWLDCLEVAAPGTVDVQCTEDAVALAVMVDNGRKGALLAALAFFVMSAFLKTRHAALQSRAGRRSKKAD